MHVLVLGPLEIVGASASAPRGDVARRVLAVLAAEANRPVHPDRLAELVWPGEKRPSGNSLQAHISRWRKVLGAHHITYAPAGYTLTLGPDEHDAAQFEELARAMSSLRSGRDVSAALERGDAALALWRGPAFAGLDDGDCVRYRRIELESLRADVVLARLEMLVEIGDHDRVVADAVMISEKDPWNEPVHRALARAHYGRGDQVAALRVLTDLDARLRSDLGLDPGVATQLLREQILNHEPALDPAPPRADVSVSTSAVRLAGRVSDLPPLSQQVLRAAALSGPDVDTAQVGRALDIGGPALADALAPALRAGIVVRADRAVRFAAAHVHEAVAALVSPGEALDLHRRLGKGLLMRRGGAEEAERAARHLAAAAALDADTALHAAELDRRLAHDAIAQARYADAVEHARRAVASADHVTGPERDRLGRVGLWLTLADALRWSGDLGSALDAYLVAAQDPDVAPDDLVRAALFYEECSLQARRHRDGARDRSIGVLEAALAAVGPDDPVRVDLLASLAQALMFAGLAERAALLGDQAVEEARRRATPEVLARTLLRRLAAHDPVRDAAARLELAGEAVELSGSGEADELELEALCAWVPELMRGGRLAEAEQIITRVEHLADVEGNVLHRCKVPMWRAALALGRGLYDEAEVLVEDFRQAGERDGYEDTARVHGFQSILIALGRDCVDDAAAILAAFDHDRAFEPWLATALLVAHHRDDHDTVQEILVPWSARRFALSKPFAGVQVFCACLVADAVAARGDAAARERLALVLRPSVGQNPVLGAGAAMLGDPARPLALLTEHREEP